LVDDYVGIERLIASMQCIYSMLIQFICFTK